MNSNTRDAPIQLIRFREGRFQVPPQAQEYLRGIEGPVGLLSVVGKYRTGKSLLLNRVLLERKAFQVSPTINSCTKGLWMARHRLEGEGAEVLVVDTEGFGATEESEAYNHKILLLAMLLSSYFVYNSVGSIDENSLASLNVVANLARELQKSNSKADRLEQEFPVFMWLVRDFSLHLVDKNGHPIQPRDYLEQALELQKGHTDAIERKNSTRRVIRHFFPDRDCFTLVRPVESEHQLQHLADLPDHHLRAEFTEQAEALRSRILRKVGAKRLRGRALDGESLLELAQSYVEAVNQGGLPNIESTHHHIQRFIQGRSLERAVSHARHSLTSSQARLLGVQEMGELEREVLGHFDRQLGEKPEGAELKARSEIVAMVEDFRRENSRRCREHFGEVWESVHHRRGSFETSWEIEDYFAELEERLIEGVRESGNPASAQQCRSQVGREKSAQLMTYCRSREQQAKQQGQSYEGQIGAHLATIASQREQLRDLEDKNHDLGREVFNLGHKCGEGAAARARESQHLNSIIQRQGTQIEGLVQRSERAEREWQRLEEATAELTHKHSCLVGEERQCREEKGLVEREVQVLRLTLEGRQGEIAELKRQVAETGARLEASEGREAELHVRWKHEQERREEESRRVEKQRDSLSLSSQELKVEVESLAQQLSNAKALMAQEKALHEQMFETFRGSSAINADSQRSEASARAELIETNKNLTIALKQVEGRWQQAEERERQLKGFKKSVKNSSCLQCQHCSKFFHPSLFLPHLGVCLVGPDALKSARGQSEAPQTQVSISETLVKDGPGRKPFTEYVIEARRGGQRWTVLRRFTAFCELNLALTAALPGVELSEVGYVVRPQEASRKSLVIEERRKVLQRYLGDLVAHPLVGQHPLLREFLDQPGEGESAGPGSPLQDSTQRVGNQAQTPEEFFRAWNERKTRGQESSLGRRAQGRV